MNNDAHEEQPEVCTDSYAMSFHKSVKTFHIWLEKNGYLPE